MTKWIETCQLLKNGTYTANTHTYCRYVGDRYITNFIWANGMSYFSDHSLCGKILVSYAIMPTIRNRVFLENPSLGVENESTWHVYHHLVYFTSPGWWMMMCVEQLVEWMAGEIEVYRENLPQFCFVNHKSNMIWPGFEPGPPWWEASDCLNYATPKFIIRSAIQEIPSVLWRPIDAKKGLILVCILSHMHQIPLLTFMSFCTSNLDIKC
jgi:hypothetical protein